MTKKVTIIIPCRNEINYIDNLVSSILAQDYPQSLIEVLFIDGCSTDGTDKAIKNYTENYPFIHYIPNYYRTVPYAMNEGIKRAKGEIIIRLDAHAQYPINYISTLVSYLIKLKADNVGGVFDTTPANDSALARGIAIVISHPFGVGNSHHRIGAQRIVETDSVPYGCYHRSVFEKIGFYDVELTRNQDDELNGRLIKAGGKIYLIPFLHIKYFARDSIKKLWKMFFQYGLFKPLVNKKLRAPATIRQFVPLLFVIGLIVGGMLSIFSSSIFYVYSLVLGIYFIFGLFIGIKATIKEKNFALIILVPLLFLIVHVSYGTGYLVGIKKILFNEKFNKITFNR